MLPAYVCCSAIFMGSFQIPNVPKAKTAERALPGIPSLALRLAPAKLAAETVNAEMLSSHYTRAVEKFGADSELAKTYADDLVRTQARIDRYEGIIERSGDVALREKADAMIVEQLRHYREGLTMTPKQQLERAKRDQEAVDRLREELDRSQPERLNQLLAEYGLQHLMKDVKPEPAPRGK